MLEKINLEKDLDIFMNSRAHRDDGDYFTLTIRSKKLNHLHRVCIWKDEDGNLIYNPIKPRDNFGFNHKAIQKILFKHDARIKEWCIEIKKKPPKIDNEEDYDEEPEEEIRDSEQQHDSGNE
jgi:hypothetical protein